MALETSRNDDFSGSCNKAGNAASIIYRGTSEDILMALADSLVTWVHLICASIWVGGSLFIGVVLVPVLKSHTKSLEELVALMIKVGRRFNKITVPAFGILIATGIYNSRGFIGDPTVLLGTTYGSILFVKVILVLATIGTYIVHVRLLNADMERKILSGQGGNLYVQSVRKKIIIIGEVTVVLSIIILLLAALLDGGI